MFYNLHRLWVVCIRMSPYHITAALIGQAIWSYLDIRISLKVQATLCCLKLYTHQNVKRYLINHLLFTILSVQYFVLLFHWGTEQPHQGKTKQEALLPVRLSQVSQGVLLAIFRFWKNLPSVGSEPIRDTTPILTQAKVGQRRHGTAQTIWVIVI